ncbi:MAG: TrkH family potassium uptake protein [Planctomycetota bacterium]
MHLAPVARVLAGFAAFFSAAQLLPLLYALFEPTDYDPELIPIAGFGASLAIGAIVSLLLWLAGRGSKAQFFRREGIAVVGLSWLLAGVLGAIPYVWSGAIPDAVDAVFETVSGLTTTGASVLGSGGNHSIEELPQSILLWRSFTQWLGGIGIVLVFVTLLPAMGITGKSLIASEQIAVGTDGFQPRMLEQARSLFVVYGTLTATCALLLWLVAGLGVFDAVNHAFTSLATGGFSTRNSSVGSFGNLAAEIVITVFMFIAGCNFGLMVTAVHRGPKLLLRDSELRVYVLITLILVGAVTAALLLDGRSLGAALRSASFNVVSVYTSTGYATEDFQAWTLPPVMLLLGSMVVGACTGSTAGGIKVIRFLVVCKLITYTVRHYLRPKSVERIKIGGQPLTAGVISAILALVLMWCGGLFLGAFVIALDDRIPFLTAMSASASMLGCCGPSLCDVDSLGRALGPDLGPMGGYGALHGATKLFLAFLMLLGRLEFLAPIALLSRVFWRR